MFNELLTKLGNSGSIPATMPPAQNLQSLLGSLGNQQPAEPVVERGISGFLGKIKSSLDGARGQGGFFERLGTFGAELQDIDDGGNRVETKRASEAARAAAALTRQTAQTREQARQALISSLTAPSRTQPGQMAGNGPMTTPNGSSGGVPSLRSAAPGLLSASLAGVDIADVVGLLDKATPNVDVVNGVAYDPQTTRPGERIGVNLSNVNGSLVDTQDAENANRFVPQVAEGQELLQDAQGNPVVRNIPGYVGGRAELEGAVSGARSAGSSPYEFVNVPTPSGAPAVVSRAQAANGIFTGQAPADAALQEGRARNQVTAEQTQAETARSDRGNLPVLQEALDLLPDVITGAGANLRLQSARFQAGLGNRDAARRVAATETFQATTGRAVLGIARQLGSGSGITNADREFAQRLAGGDIELNRESIARILRLEQQAIARRQSQAQGARPAAAPASGNFTPAQIAAELRRRGLN